MKVRPDDKKIIFSFFFKYITVVQNERTELNTADKQHTSISPRCIGRNKNTGIFCMWGGRVSTNQKRWSVWRLWRWRRVEVMLCGTCCCQLMQEMDVQHFALKRYVEFLGSVGRLTCSVMRTVTPKPSTASTLVHSSEDVTFLLAARCCRRLSADIL